MIGERIQDVRRYFGDTQKQLAESIGMSVHSVRGWEEGKSNISIEALLAICKHYQVSSDYLLGLIEEEPSIVNKQREELTQENKALLRRFEAFLVNEQKRKHKNSR